MIQTATLLAARSALLRQLNDYVDQAARFETYCNLRCRIVRQAIMIADLETALDLDEYPGRTSFPV